MDTILRGDSVQTGMANGRIEKMFSKNLRENRKALITFLTAGDPDIDTTEKLVLAMDQSGADMIELGVPYSDPIAEGPVIQAANERALINGIKFNDIFRLVAKLREKTQKPLVLLLYVNSILQYGKDRFFKECLQFGIDGVIIPDLPYEERDEISYEAKLYGIRMISLVTPVSEERIEKLVTDAEGFIYCVSSLGVTGVRGDFQTDFEHFFGLIDRFRSIPTAIGFGISDAEQVRQVKGYADSVIIGSAIVKKIAQAQNPNDAVNCIGHFVKELRAALDEPQDL
jgi:tryptophan synthase alpha chain